MFAIKSMKSIVIHVLLIAAVLFNGFPSSVIVVQARQESAPSTSPNIHKTEQKAKTSDSVIAADNGLTTDIGINPSIAFVENVGQFDPRVRFQAQSTDANIYFSEDAIWFTLLEPPAKDPSEDRHSAMLEGLIAEQQESRKGVNLKVNLIGSNPHPTFESFNRVATSFSYFAGSDPSNWQSDVPVWSGIRYVDLYPGMDLEITSEQNHLLWQFVITDASRFYDRNNPVAQQGIRIKIAGHQKLQAQNKNLDIVTEVGELFLPAIRLNGAEIVPQITKNDELIIPIPAQTSLSSDTFKMVAYRIPSSTGQDGSPLQESHSSTQTIDSKTTYQPSSDNVLIYSAYFGTKYTLGDAITVDNDGAVYVTGNPGWTDFPTGAGAFYLPGASSTSFDTFIAKIDLAANQLIYTAFFKKYGSCGVNFLDGDIAVDNNKNVYVVGITGSTNFPTTTGVIDRQLTDICPSSGQTTDFPADGFVLKLNAAGNQLLYSTYLGGSEFDSVGGVVVGADGSAYVAGYTYSTDIPKGTQGYTQTLNGPSDLFITKLSPAADQQEFFTYIGGSTWESTFGNLKVGNDGSIYLEGMTIVQQQCSQQPITDCRKAFALKLDPTGNNLNYLTYLGEVGTGFAADLDVDAAGNAYIGGWVRSADFPHTQLIGPGSPSGADGFAVKLSSNGSVLYSTLVGGTRFDAFWAISVDTSGNAYLVGDSSSPDFPVPPAAIDRSVEDSGQDLIVARLNSSGSQLTYATFLGGSTWDYMSYHGAPLDSNGNLNILVRDTESTDFLTNHPPIGNGTNDSNLWGWNTAALVRLSAAAPVIPYDCSWSLSPIGKAVFNVVVPDKQDVGEVCGNLYEADSSLITLPPGYDAFNRFAQLAEQAMHEIDFTTMDWDPAKDNDPTNTNDSAGEIFLRGVKSLYDNVRQNPGNYPAGVHIKILLGQKERDSLDQRATVLNDLQRLGIPRTPPDLNWTVEVASFRNPFGIHSHVKTMIVDGKQVVVAGYNMQYTYFEDIPWHDVGIDIKGPIAQRALKVFDGLWVGANRCEVLNATADGCYEETTIQSPISHDPAVLVPTITGNEPVFSLYRDHDDHTAENAVSAAINAASSEVNILQQRFVTYPTAVLNALENGNGQVQVNVLASGDWEDKVENIAGICDLWSQLPSGIRSSVEAKLTSKQNPMHTKALSIDGKFIVVGSQNWDPSSWGSLATSPINLSEYDLGVDSTAAATDFNANFWDQWAVANPSLCLGGGTTSAAIQTAINQADPGTAVFIPNGTYTGLITVNKPVVLVGEDPKNTVFQAQGNEPAFRITSSNVTVANLNVAGGTGYGIELIDSSPSSLKDILINRVTFTNNAQGGVLVQGLIAGSPVNYAVESSAFIGGTSGITINMLETQAVTSSVRDNIFSGQSTSPIRILSSNDGGVEYSYNLFDGCGLGTCTTNWHQGNLNASSSEHNNLFDLNPLFIDSANGDYQLSVGSPAIDAGDPSLQEGPYLDGNNDGIVRIDVGVFEYTPAANVAPIVNAGNDQTVEFGIGVVINATYTDPDNSNGHSAKIDWGDGMIEDVPVNMTSPGAGEVNAQHVYSSLGNYTVEVCVTDPIGGVGCDTLNIAISSGTGPTNTPTSTPTNTPTSTPTNTATNTPTFTPTFTPTNTPTNTPTSTPTFTPTSTPTNTATVSNNFPTTGILDSFNRANGSIGSNWYGNTSGYNVSSNKLLVKSRNTNLDIYWNNTSFGPNQEAYFTFSSVNTTSVDQDLILKSQYVYGWAYGLIDVQYEAAANRVVVWTYDHNQSWVQYGADIPVTFVNGDRFGARALANGTLEVYRNGALIATRDISAWPDNANGGYIGLWFGNAKDALIDDFGGGTIP